RLLRQVTARNSRFSVFPLPHANLPKNQAEPRRSRRVPRFLAFSVGSPLLVCCMLAFSGHAQTSPAFASSADAAKSAVADFYNLMFNADPKALDLLVFMDRQVEKAGRTLIQLALAQQRVRLAALHNFG